jgi:signal peptidase II
MSGGVFRRRGARLVVIAGIVALAVACDHYTKELARTLLERGEPRSLAGGLVVLTYAENEGAFLSLGSRWPRPLRTAVLSGLSSLALTAAAVYLASDRRSGARATVGLSLVVGGGLGNLVDRLTRGGYVTDFLNLGIGGLRTGIFNLADVFLLAGAVLLLTAPGRRRLS